MLSERSKPVLVASITALAIVLSLLLAEGAVRLRQTIKYGSAATLEDFYRIDQGTGLRIPVANLSDGRISVNSLGFRGPEIEVPRPQGTVRIAFLGASTTWCAEVSGNELVWPHLVAESLKRSMPGATFDYVNGGVPGYVVESITKGLRHRVAPLQPDVIVVYEVSNNLSGELRERAAAQSLISNSRMQELTWPGRYSLLWNLVEKNLRILAAQRAAADDRNRLDVDPTTMGERFRKDLTQLLRDAQSHAPLVAVATFAIQPRRDQSPAQQMRASASALFYTPFVTPRLLIEAYERYNQIVREVAKETGVLLIEGENGIPGDAVHFADTVHFTDAGSIAMASRISAALAGNQMLRNLAAERAGAR